VGPVGRRWLTGNNREKFEGDREVLRKVIGVGACLAFALLLISNGEVCKAQAQEKRTGSVTGEIKTKKDTPNGKNVIIEVLATGEEKARPYRVQYDQTAKGPIPDVLAAVRKANIGDKVQFDWIDTGEGLAIKKFEVIKKKESDKK
jgi:hypothetical protein